MVGTGWYGSQVACGGLSLSIILSAEWCSASFLLATRPWHEYDDGNYAGICMPGDCQLSFTFVHCHPFQAEGPGDVVVSDPEACAPCADWDPATYGPIFGVITE